MPPIPSDNTLASFLSSVSAARIVAGLSGALMLSASFPSLATPIVMSFVRKDTSSHLGIAVDSATGEVYQKNGYGPGYGGGTGPTSWTRYANAAAFEADSPASTVISDTNLWGTYVAAHDGSVFARSALSLSGPFDYPVDARVSKLSGSSGAQEAAVNVTGMGGLGLDQFDWGGFSAVNTMDDGTHLYVVGSVGGANTDDWQISTYDYDLNAINAVTFSLDPSYPFMVYENPGFAFAIANYIFLGDDYTDGQISRRVNAKTGVIDEVDFRLTGFDSVHSGRPYINNVTYDSFHDTLYVHSADHAAFFKLADATSAFGLDLAVPEPTSFALCSLAMLGARRRNRRSAWSRVRSQT